MTLKDAKKDYEKTEDDLKSLQSVGQIIGEVLRQLDEDRCEWRETEHADMTGGKQSMQMSVTGNIGPTRPRVQSQPHGYYN